MRLLCLLCCVLVLSAQQSKTQSPEQEPDVIHIKTELIQSPVMVFDKQGHFVDGLKREQFELNIDGRPRAISFFDRLSAGSAAEAGKYQPGRQTSSSEKRTTRISSTGRTVIFFVDDLHLTQESVYRTRMSLLHYIDNSMGQNDRLLITSTTGQIGFLQQLSDNKEVLRAAVERLNYREMLMADDSRPPMSPYQALKVQENDPPALNYFADMAVKDQFSKVATSQGPAGGSAAVREARADNQRRQAEDYVRNRARNILLQYSTISASTFVVLKNFLRSLDQWPGNKTVFFISDGFFLNQQMIGEIQKLNEITSNALRSGVVVYSIQASGLSNSYVESTKASKEVRLSPRMDPGVPGLGEDTALQAALYTIAADTGGRAFFNSNSIDRGIRQALQDTSEYYLIAWRPEPDENRSPQFRRIQIAVKDHPEWEVRVQKGYFLEKEKSSDKPAQVTVTKQEINEAITRQYPARALPVNINATFMDAANGGLQATIASEIAVGPSGQTRTIELMGLLLNDQGKTVATFGGQMSVEATQQTISHSDVLQVKPGIYQARIAARDSTTGLIGTAMDWLVVPDLSAGKLTLGSILVGETRNSDADKKALLNVSHRFAKDSKLRFLTYIYNASRAQTDVSVQLRLVREDQVISTSALTKLTTESLDDLSRIPYAAELSLRLLPSGRYALIVTAFDNSTKSTASQTTKFIVY